MCGRLRVGTPVEDKLRRANRVMARLTALHELWKHVLVARQVSSCRFRGLGGACFADAARSWWGPDRGPLGLRPLARGVFFRVPRESSSSDVLTRTSGRRGEHPPTGAPYVDASSKAPLRSLPDAFHRRMPARPDACAPSLERGPATEPRFCHPGPGFRRSFAPSPREGEGARPGRFSESSSLRCVRGHTPFVDFCQRDDPQARPSDDRHPALRALTWLSPG
jgi:hypothetical protein